VAIGFFKVVGFTEPAAYLFAITAGTLPTDTCAAAGVLVGFKDVDPDSPIDMQTSITGFSTSIIAPSVNATRSTLLVGLFGSNGPVEGITPPVSMMFDADPLPGGSLAIESTGFANALIAWEEVSDGPTGTRTATLVDASAVAGALITLTPR
jgi:hypothetical protein